MVASAIREFAVSRSPQLLAAAYFEKIIQIWNPLTQKKINEFPTIYSFGARNLALSPDAKVLVVGRSTTSGKVAAYSVPDGKKLWEQKLIYPSRLKFTPSGDSILCSTNHRSTVRLDSQIGAVLERRIGVKELIEGPYGDSLAIPAREDKTIRLLAHAGSFDISKISFAVLDAKFSPDSVCMTEAGGPVRCFSVSNGRLQWIFDPTKGEHVLNIHYSPAHKAFFGVLKDCERKGPSSRHLLRFDVLSGATTTICQLDSWEDVFLGETDQLITSAGAIVNLADGEIAGRLSFPQREYPDD